MRKARIYLALVLVLSVAAMPEAGFTVINQPPEDCCLDCAYYEMPLPGGGTQIRTDCLGFDCRSGWRHCWESTDEGTGCILMWSCRFF
jgi:hypothetical protein